MAQHARLNCLYQSPSTSLSITMNLLCRESQGWRNLPLTATAQQQNKMSLGAESLPHHSAASG